MTILSVALSLLGVNDNLPTSHAERTPHLASKRESFAQKRAAEVLRADNIVASGHAAEREALAALDAAEAEHVAQLDLALGTSLFKALAPHVRSFCEQSNRASSREIAQVIVQHESRAQHELGRGLSVRVLAIAFGVALIEQDPAALGAFAAVDSSGTPALFPLFASYNFADTHGSALAGRSASAKLVPELEALEIHLLKYSEMRVHAVDDAAKDRWAVMVSAATQSAFNTRWKALVEQQKAEADAADAPARTAARAAWLTKQAQIGNESAQAVAKAEGLEVPKLETLDEHEDDEHEDDEHEDDELEVDEDDELDAEELASDAGNAEPASYEEAGYVNVPEGVERVRG